MTYQDKHWRIWVAYNGVSSLPVLTARVMLNAPYAAYSFDFSIPAAKSLRDQLISAIDELEIIAAKQDPEWVKAMTEG